MEKSLLLQKEEFVKTVVDTINSTGIPLFITEYALKDILNDVHMLVQQELEEEINTIQQMQQMEQEKVTETVQDKQTVEPLNEMPVETVSSADA